MVQTLKFYLKCNGKSLKNFKQRKNIINVTTVSKILTLSEDWSEGGARVEAE